MANIFAEAYFEVLKDAFISNFILTFQKEWGFSLLMHFGEYNNVIGLVYALIGSILGLYLTFLIFYIIAKKFHQFLDKSVSYQPFCDFVNKYKYIFALPIMLPEMTVLVPFFAGFAKMDKLKFLTICVVYRALFYVIILYYPEIYW